MLRSIDSNSCDELGRAYPRPLLRRGSWISLNGEWDFAIDADAVWQHPSEVSWLTQIKVPFAAETVASGIGHTGFLCAGWYRRSVALPRVGDGERLLLHFGAVDYEATVWIGGQRAWRHEGGYTPFRIDVTGWAGTTAEIAVRAYDDPEDLAKPRGKQDWQLEPHSIWYPRTTGIWQTVWLEVVPPTWIDSLRWRPSIERWEIGLESWLGGVRRDGLRHHVMLNVGGQLIADDTYSVIRGEVHRRIALSDPGIDDYRNELLWSPESPTLIDATLEIWGDRGKLIDRVKSYTALRTIAPQRDRSVHNNRP